jgi:predicted site-specific integrase-resolvase
MFYYSTREAAKKLGIPHTTLATYIAVGKVPVPQAEIKGKTTTQIWTEEEIEHVRKLLPKIANGRKTRYSKVRKKQKAQPRAAVPHKTRKPRKKKSP